MEISAMGDFDGLDTASQLGFNHVGNWNGREVEVLGPECALRCAQFKTTEIEPMMIKTSVRRRDKNGNETEVSVEVDTRKPERPKSEPPKNEDPSKKEKPGQSSGHLQRH